MDNIPTLSAGARPTTEAQAETEDTQERPMMDTTLIEQKLQALAATVQAPETVHRLRELVGQVEDPAQLALLESGIRAGRVVVISEQARQQMRAALVEAAAQASDPADFARRLRKRTE